MIRVDVCGRTDVGRTREHNEDAFLLADVGDAERLPDDGVTGYAADGKGLLFMVADGMGGAAAGEIASDMAVRTVLGTLAERWRDGGTLDPTAFAASLRDAAEEANRRIHATAAEHPEYRGMGTTATIAGLLGDTLYLAQVGDSRGYILRGGRMLQITKDQSLLQRLVEAGEMTVEEAERSDRRNIILQALGPDANVVIDLTHQQVRRGDVLILCSDGLSGTVRDEEIARLAGEAGDLCELCDSLIEAANAAGGPDNITVVAVRFLGDGLPEARAEDLVGHRRFPDAASPAEDDWINRDPVMPPPPLGNHAAHGAPGRPSGGAPLPPPPLPSAVRNSDGAAIPVVRAAPVPREKGELVVRVLRVLVVLTALATIGLLAWRLLLP